MIYKIRGGGKVNLKEEDDFIAKGGEGKIYGKGNIVYKIYKDPDRMIPEAKIQELAELKLKNILNPQNVILDKNNTPIGFTMDWVKNTTSLCQFFTNDFKEEFKVGDDKIIKLTENFKEGIYYIHRAKCLLVDCNEFNFLVSTEDYVTPQFIDVNAYKTPSFKADALMASVKDWHSNSFSELTDWFSWGVLICQLFIGVHPYKGRHPKYGRKELEKRMKDNVSIFNPDVKLAPTARPFNTVPKHYLDWFVDLFEKGKRKEPPALPGSITTRPVMEKTIQGDNIVNIEFLKEFDDIIISHRKNYGKSITITRKSIYIDSIRYKVNDQVDAIITAQKLVPILVKIEDETLKFKSLGKYNVNQLPLKCTEKMVIGNIVYVKYKGKLTEVILNDKHDTVIPCVHKVWNIMPNSSKMFKQVIYQSVLGKPYLVIPFFRGLITSCMVKPIPELKNYRIVNAKRSLNVCVLIGHDGNKYDRIILRFNDMYQTYDCRITEDVDNSINFTALEKGVTALMAENNTIELFFNDLETSKVQPIQSSCLNNTMKLCKNGVKLLFTKKNKLYSISMK